MATMDELIDRAADKYGLDRAYFRRLVAAESAGNPAARSPAGAVGLTQLMPGTAAEMGVTDRTDPEQSLDGGAHYLRNQVDRFGDPKLAAAAYNAGPGRVARAGGVPNIPETQNYVRKVAGDAGPPSDEELDHLFASEGGQGGGTGAPGYGDVAQWRRPDGKLEIGPGSMAPDAGLPRKGPNGEPSEEELDQLFQNAPPALNGGPPQRALPAPNVAMGGDPGPLHRLPGGGVDPMDVIKRSALAVGGNAINAGTFGLARKATAVSAALPQLLSGGLPKFTDQYSSNMDALDARGRADMRDVPGAAATGTVGGVLASAIALPEVRAAGWLARLGIGAAQGAMLGGAQHYGGDRGDMRELGRTGAAPMAVGGLFGGSLGAALGPRAVGGTRDAASAADYARAGVDPSLAVTGGTGSRMVGQALAGNAFLGGPLRASAANTLAQIDTSAANLASRYGNATTPFTAGGALRRGAQGAVDSYRARTAGLYNAVSAVDRSAQPVPVSSTAKAVDDIFAAYPTPAMQDWLAQNAPKLAQVRTTLSNAGGQMTVAELKAFRGDIGKLIDDKLTVGNIDQARLKQLYGAMSDDYYAGARMVGGSPAEAALRRADQVNAAQMGRIENTLGNVLKTNSAEDAYSRVVAMGQSTSRADLQQLGRLRRSLSDEDWSEAASGIIHRLGRDADGNFSAASFATQWGKLTLEARRTFFGGAGREEDLRALDSLAAVARDVRAASKFYNNSQSGNVAQNVMTAQAGLGAVGAAAASALGHGGEGTALALPGVMALGAVGAGASKLLASPGFARMVMRGTEARTLARQVEAYSRANPRLFGELEDFRGALLSRLGDTAPVSAPSALVPLLRDSRSTLRR